jgi:putative nucleotidyltransferase with HDIG domain
VRQQVQLQGDLDEMPVGHLLQWMSWSRKSGLLELHGPAESYELRFVEGRLVLCSRYSGGPSRVELDRGSDPDALQRLLREPLRWTEGHFVLYELDAPGAEQAEALLEGAREAAVALGALLTAEPVEGQSATPAVSETAAKLARMSRDPRTSLKQLSEVVSTDPALMQAILRYANASSGGPGQPIDSLAMAVARVGFRTIRPLALAVCVYSRELHSPQLRQELPHLWRHCLSVALLARTLSGRLRLDEDAAFLGGLLHDMGKAVLLARLDELGQQGRTPRALPTGALRELLAEHHTKIARTLHPSWELP